MAPGTHDTAEVGVVLPATSVAGNYQVVEAARLAEELGFASVWAPDHLAFHTGVLEPVVTLAAAAAVTTRVRLAFGVLLVALRHPAWLAKQLASLQTLSGGRIVLGVGVGGEYPPEWQAAGIPRHGRGRRTDAVLEVLPALLAGAEVRLPAPWDAVVPALAPAGPIPPIWVGGRSAPAVERAARYADGWLGIWSGADLVARHREVLHRRAAELGRPQPRTGLAVFTNIDDAAPRAALAEATGYVCEQYRLPPARFARYVLAGTAAQVRSRLDELLGAGLDQLVVVPAAADYPAQYRRIADLLADRLVDRRPVRTHEGASSCR